jgi:hypothetical protein
MGLRFSTAQAGLRSRRRIRAGCLASAHRPTGTQRRGCGLAWAGLCTEFSTEIVETAAETFAGPSRLDDGSRPERLAEPARRPN